MKRVIDEGHRFAARIKGGFRSPTSRPKNRNQQYDVLQRTIQTNFVPQTTQQQVFQLPQQPVLQTVMPAPSVVSITLGFLVRRLLSDKTELLGRGRTLH